MEGFRFVTSQIFLNLYLLTCLLLNTDLISANNGANYSRKVNRKERSLVWPKGGSKVQAIFGVGFPVGLEDQSVTIGNVIKCNYKLPRNATDYTQPTIDFEKRRRRQLATKIPGRWEIYDAFSQVVHSFGLSGKACLLRTICEAAAIPFDKTGALIGEILHVILTPSSTNDLIRNQFDNEYHAAEEIGRENHHQCNMFYPECNINFIDFFTVKI